MATSTPRPFASSRAGAGASSVAPLTAWGRAHLQRLLQLVAAYVDRDDLRRAERARHLHHLRAHAADGEDGDALSGADVGLVPHGAVGGEDGAADDGGVRERHALRQREDGRVRRHGVLGEPAHAVHGDGFAVRPVQPRRAVVKLSLEAVIGEERLAKVLASTDAVAAVAARHDERADDAVAHGDVRNAGADGVRDAGDLVAEHSGRRESYLALEDMEVGVTDAARCDLHPHLVLVGFRHDQFLNGHGLVGLGEDCGAHD